MTARGTSVIELRGGGGGVGELRARPGFTRGGSRLGKNVPVEGAKSAEAPRQERLCGRSEV